VLTGKTQVLSGNTSNLFDIDACHCSNGMLYRIMGKDANRMSVPGLEQWPIHNEASVQWKQVLVILKSIYGVVLDNEDVVFISDEQKGLKTALRSELPKANLFMCQKHLEAEVTTHCGHGASAKFLSLASAKRHEQFNALLDEAPLALTKYLGTKEDKSEWSGLHAPVCLHGNTASTVSESNVVWT